MVKFNENLVNLEENFLVMFTPPIVGKQNCISTTYVI